MGGDVMDLPAGFKVINAPQENKAIPLPAGFKVVEPSKMGVGESFAIGAGQGASMGFGDELIAGLGAGVAGTGLNITNALGITDVESPYAQSYDNILNKQRAGIEQAYEDNPITYTGGAIAGAIAGGGKLTAPLAATKIGGKIASATLPTAAGRVVAGTAKVAAPAYASGYIAEFGAGEGGLENRMAKAEEGGLLSAALGVAAKPIMKGLSKGATLTKETFFNRVKNLDADAIGDMAQASYARANDLGGKVKPQVTNAFIANIEKAGMQTEAGKAISGETPVASLVQRVQALKNKPLSLLEVQEMDEALGDVIDTQYTVKGLTKQGKKLLDVQSALRNVIADAPDDAFEAAGREGFDALKEGRRLYSRKMAMREVERIIERANSFDQPATAVKTGFRTLNNNPKRLRGFTGAEKELIKKAAESGLITDTLRTMGSRLNPIIAAGATGNPAYGLATKVGSDLSRSAGYAMQARKAGNVAKEISRNVQGLEPSNVNINIPSRAIGAGVAAQPDNQQQAPKYNLEPVDYNPFAQPSPNNPDGVSPQQEPLTLDITPQSYNTQMQEFTYGNEGSRSTVYNDTLNNRTVARGFNLDDKSAPRVWRQAGLSPQLFNQVKRGEAQLTQYDQDALFQASYDVADKDARSYYPDFDNLSQSQQVALIDMSYQMGGNTLKQFKGLHKALKNGDKNAIVSAIRKSKYYEQTPQRAAKVASMLSQGNK